MSTVLEVEKLRTSFRERAGFLGLSPREIRAVGRRILFRKGGERS
jgi:hypothetical protein